MRVPINWLTEYVDVTQDDRLLAEKFTSIGHMEDKPPEKAFGDTVLDLEVRQNRPDCLSIIGLARELSAVFDKKVEIPNSYNESLPELNGKTKINIETEDCYRFNTLTIEEVSVTESPKWLKQKLQAYGIKAINNIVDITNYVMLEIGQPLHAFDLSKINEGELTIRHAKDKEPFSPLGTKKVLLSKEDLVISSKDKVVALAGVIGGKESGVAEKSTSIVVEAANYNQALVRRSSLLHNLRTEASTRLEKFLHPKLTEMALRRAGQLITEICGGKIVDHNDKYPTPKSKLEVELSYSKINQLGGIKIPKVEAQEILRSLELPTKHISNNKFIVEIPYFRTDIKIEADLVEEVLRIYGYEKIPERLPHTPPPRNIQSPFYELEDKIRDILVACGYDEQITEPLTIEKNSKHPPIKLENSLSSEKTTLRTTLENTLLEALKNQIKYNRESISLFEVGKIYYTENDSYLEKRTLGIMASAEKLTYFDIKGVAEILFERLGYKYNESILSIKGVNLSQPTYYLELDIDALISGKKIQAKKILTSPPRVVLRDLSVVLPEKVNVGEILEELKKIDPLVYKVQLGEDPREIEHNNKSVFINLSYHKPGQNISNKDIEKTHKKIEKFLKTDFKAQIR